MPSLRGKILTAYGFSKAVLLVFAVVVFADLYYLQTRIVAGEAVATFREASQEMRRDEKNLFLYDDLTSLDQLLEQLSAAESALRDGQHAFAEIATPRELGRVSDVLAQYRAQLTQYPTLVLRDRSAQEKKIRATGHALSTLAETFSRRERAVLAQAVHVAGITLLAVFVTVLLLGAAVFAAQSERPDPGAHRW